MLTILRFGLTGLFIYFFLLATPSGLWMATLAFVLAAVTDWLDGFLARRLHLESALGKILDPLADKFLMLSAFFLFAIKGIIPMWMVVLIAVREIGVTAYRFWAASRGWVLAAERLGKWKTVAQMVFALGILAILLGQLSDPGLYRRFEDSVWIAAWIVVILTAVSGAVFLKNNLALLNERRK